MIIKLQKIYSQDKEVKDENSPSLSDSQNKNKFNLKHALIGAAVHAPVYLGTEYALEKTLLGKGLEKDINEFDSAVDKLKEEKTERIRIEKEKLLESHNSNGSADFNRKLGYIKDKIEKEFEEKVDELSKKLQKKTRRKEFLTSSVATAIGAGAGYWTMQYLNKRKENKNKEKD